MGKQAVVVLALGILGAYGCGEDENPAAPAVVVAPDLDLALVPVPAGSFTMGDGGSDCGHDQRIVTLTHPFRIGATEVTNGQFVAALQWAFDTGRVAVAGDAVVDLVELRGTPLLELNQSGSEIP